MPRVYEHNTSFFENGKWYRVCCKCRVKKPLDEFYKSKVDFLNKKYRCKKCDNLVCFNYRTKYKDKYLKQARERQRKNRNPEYSRTHYYKYPQKSKARQLFSYLIQYKKIIPKPCVVCDNTESQAHHPDYSKPYEVFWLCGMHHSAVHRKYEPLVLNKNLLSNYINEAPNRKLTSSVKGSTK